MFNSLQSIDSSCQILGVSRTASLQEVKTAYRNLVRQFHPDVNQQTQVAEERLKEINGAYEILCQHLIATQKVQPIASHRVGDKQMSSDRDLRRSNQMYETFISALQGHH